MIHKMNLKNEPFKLINSGTKTIEMRLYDDKRQKINIGDIIEFNNDYDNEVIKVEVINLHQFDNFYDLYNKFDKVSIGYKESDAADPNDMRAYYSDEDIKKYGVVGIEIKKL